MYGYDRLEYLLPEGVPHLAMDVSKNSDEWKIKNTSVSTSLIQILPAEGIEVTAPYVSLWFHCDIWSDNRD